MKNSFKLRNERKARMTAMHETMTLQEIAEIYEITRERVRQIIGNFGHALDKKRTSAKIAFVKSNPHLTNSEINKNLADRFGSGLSQKVSAARAGMRHAIEDGLTKLGTDAEILVSQKLNSLGIKNELMPHHHLFDIQLASGKTIDVKSRISKSIAPSAVGRLKTAQWRFTTRKEKKGDYCDFFICYLWETNDFFVIPNDVATEQIVFCWPPASKPSKWHKYHNRFDLLY